jgi:hypothetical protein
MSKPKKPKPSFDLPRSAGGPDASWVYRTEPAPPVLDVSPADIVVETVRPDPGKANGTARGGAADFTRLPASLLKGTVFFVELSLNITEAVPEMGFNAFKRMASYVPGSGGVIGILGIPIQANAAACSAGRRMLRAISGGTT